MPILARFGALLLLAILSIGAAHAQADIADIKKAVQEKLAGKIAPESIVVTKTTHLGLYEVFADGQLFYTDENVRYFILGDLVDAKTMKSITEERVRVLTAIKFDTLPLDLAIKTVKGSGRRKVAVFSDPDCPYCRKLEQTLNGVNDVTIYTFLYPIASLHPNATERSKAVWCAADRRKAWDDYMQRNIAPEAKSCDTSAIDTLAQLGQKYKINGTPTLVFADGRVVPGAIPGDQMEKYLGKP